MLRAGDRRAAALTAALFVAPLIGSPGAAAGEARHPPAATREGCVTRQCHARLLEKVEPAPAGSVHQPAGAGECHSCHDLALPAEARFVKGAPGEGDEGSPGARGWDQALCAGCHGELLAAPGSPAGTTGFADGGRNLHALHVLAGRGRRCLVCHDAHASRQARLLRELLPARGGARIAQEFRGETNGGWCRTGCHAPKRYRR